MKRALVRHSGEVKEKKEKGKRKLKQNPATAVMKKESVETTAIFTPDGDGYRVTFPNVPGLVFHTVTQLTNPAILEEIEDAYDLVMAKEAEARNDFISWDEVRDQL